LCTENQSDRILERTSGSIFENINIWNLRSCNSEAYKQY